MSEGNLGALADVWQGPHGGLPPFDRLTPGLVEQAVHEALQRKRQEISAITGNTDPPTFANTIEALEDSGRALKGADILRRLLAATRAEPEMVAVNARLAPVLATFDDEIVQDEVLFARINAVHAARHALAPDEVRLTEIIRNAMLRRGAGLAPKARQRLTTLNRRLAELQSAFAQNMMSEATRDIVLVEAEDELAGVPEHVRTNAAALAERRGHPGKWAIANARPAVWPILQFATNRKLRKRVREMWMNRCGTAGPHDNRPVIAEILKRRGEKARLLGHDTFAHWAIADRMARTPEAALRQLLDVWAPVRRKTQARIAEVRNFAAAHGHQGPLDAEDWLHFLEKYRKARFGFDADEVRQYLSLDNVLGALFHAAGRLHGLSFRERPDAPRLHPDIRVVEVVAGENTLGLIWFDLMARESKQAGSWQAELRAAETFRGRTIPLSTICSSLEPARDGPVLMGWEYANVLFHEFGHALHVIMSRARYPSLGPMGVPWDMVELPSQLNERWLRDRDLLRRFARHHRTGDPIPDALIDAIEAAAAFDRVISVGVEYLAPAIVDLRMNLAADGGDVDPMTIEREVYSELGMPAMIDPVMRLPHQAHSFTDAYAAGLYVYLWADVLVADVLEAFEAAPGGLYDETIARRWRDTILCAGAHVAGEQAFRDFRGRDPDPNALLRRFALA